ncbi:MAG TPA: sigma-70 family RNA polymerase sigma factor [Actinopolymorphaceae bacterium]|jgi:RNA polymerase sigma-70 factor (ECF subfamily)
MPTPADGAATAESVFSEIFRTHQPGVYAYLLGRLGDPEAARDLLQDVFLRVWRNLDEVRSLPTHRRHAWIFTVARNLVTDAYRSRATRRATTQALASLVTHTAPPPDEPHTRAESAELLNAVTRAVRSLPEELRVILAMHVVGELTSAQIGEALGQPAGTIRYKLARARQALAAQLAIPPEPGMEVGR